MSGYIYDDRGWEILERDLVKFFGAGLNLIGSALLNLTMPSGRTHPCTDLIERIADDGKARHVKPLLHDFVRDLKHEMAEGSISPDMIARHARDLPGLIESHPPGADDIRAATDPHGQAGSTSMHGGVPTARTLAEQLIDSAREDGSLEAAALSPELSRRMLSALFGHLLKSRGRIALLRESYIKYHSDAQTEFGLRALERGREKGNMKDLMAAVEALEFAQHIQTENMVPENWAKLQNDKGAALGIIGEHTGDPIKLRQAIDVLKAAADICKKDDHPDLWVETQNENEERAALIHANLEHMLLMIRAEKGENTSA